MNFQQKLDSAIEKNNSLLCVGLDPVLEKIPEHLQKVDHPFFAFCKEIIEATHDLVCCYKPNSAFFESLGEKGIGELKKICSYIRTTYPEIPILLDFKRGDIGNTNKGYTTFAFEYLEVDAVTVQPYLGKEAVLPFLEMEDKGIFILCKTSNPGSGEFQNLMISDRPLYEFVAEKVTKEWNERKNCYFVVGATYPEELKKVRKIVGDMTLLVPGLGSQGGEVESIMKAGLTPEKKGMIINSSREVLYAGREEDFAEKAKAKAQTIRDTINTYRNL